jgi:CYTH domain-containing protein
MSDGIELERKFLVARSPDGLERCRATSVRQGYLALDPAGVEVRVRLRAGRATLTIKGGRGRARAEEEFELDRARFERLWPLTEGRRIEKTRYEVPLEGGLTAELDLYGGPLEGLMTAEVEFGSTGEADAYKNRRLAVDGLPADRSGPTIRPRPRAGA